MWSNTLHTLSDRPTTKPPTSAFNSFLQHRVDVSLQVPERGRLQRFEVYLDLVRIRVTQRWLVVLYDGHHAAELVTCSHDQ